MIPFLTPLSGFWKRKPVNIYDNVFKLHSKFTVCILIAATLFLSANRFFGVAIDCEPGKYKSQVDNFCWMAGTFISNKAFNGSVGKHFAHYGIAPLPVAEEDRNYQKYYQWVTIFLMLHAILFYLPAYCWKTWENRTMSRLIGYLSDDFFVKQDGEDRMKHLYNFFLHRHYRTSHNLYAARYMLAEVMNLAVVIGNVLLLNFFLTDFWFEFWPAVSVLTAFDYNSWLSRSAKTFPRVAKCEFHFVGASGSIQLLQSMCLLPLNVLNEKIYAFIYIWFLILLVISAVNVLWKLLLIACRPLRMLLIRAWFREVPSYQWEGILDGGRYGQWFLFCRIGFNLSTNIVCVLADRLCHTQRDEYYLK